MHALLNLKLEIKLFILSPMQNIMNFKKVNQKFISFN